MKVRVTCAGAAVAAALLTAGCGSSDDGGASVSGGAPNPNDKRAVALACITKEKKLPARLVGKQSIHVGGAGGPRVEFFVTSGEAEGLQFQGQAQGAEQIGAALLFVNAASEHTLDLVEQCLDDQ
jgi:hypothetical protein